MLLREKKGSGHENATITREADRTRTMVRRSPSGNVESVHSATVFVRDRIDQMLGRAGEDRYPRGASGQDLRYDTKDDPTGWTPSFWTGLLWLADAVWNDTDRYRSAALSHLEPFRDRLERDDAVLTHDLGFLYTLSAWAQYDRTGDERARQVALRAADRLTDRYHPTPGIIQAWGDHRSGLADQSTWEYGGTIVDTMLNLPLLYRAGEATAYDRYREIATDHADATATHIVRDDGSTCHGFRFDVATGEPEGERTHQGAADDSCWSRGQAWALYGFPLAYRHSGEERFLETAQSVAEYYLSEVPSDYVPPWDFRADDTDIRDTSAAAIAACGFFELAEHLPPAHPDRQRYERTGVETLTSLAQSYTTEGDEADGILAQSAANCNKDQYDQCTLWGDYFYFEGLVRASFDWTPFWCR
jgi:unsaturated chondroitin disaccharide hydrolase